MSRVFLIIQLAIYGLLKNKIRSFLTILGIIIGIASVIALMSVGEGARQDVVENISSRGTNIITIHYSDKNGEGFNNRDLDFLENNDRFSNIEIISPVISESLLVEFKENDTRGSISGVSERFDEIEEIGVSYGRFLNENDIKQVRSVAVIGSEIATELFPGYGLEEVVGEKIKLGESRLKIVGIIEEQEGTGYAEPNIEVYIPYTAASKKVLLVDSYTQLKIKVSNVDALETTVSEIETKLYSFKKIREDEEENLKIYTSEELISLVSEATETFTILLSAIASISLLVGGIGISNIMLVSVTERTREIGLRKAVGARQSDILLQFLLEAILLTLFGGIFGIALGAGSGQLISRYAEVSSVVTLNSIILATSVAIGIGVIFGFAPARKAAKLNPIDALRYE